MEEWQDATEVIELELPKDDALERLLRVCRARSARSEGQEQERLERLRRRLQDAARRRIRFTDRETRLTEVESALRSISDPTAALTHRSSR